MLVPAEAATQPAPRVQARASPRAGESRRRARRRRHRAVVDSETTSGLGARNIGSAAMRGRVAALAAVHEGDRLTVYVGAASGGVWKSMNGGTTFKPMFDKQTVQSIGAIAIDPKNPKTVWVGTGEAWMRNSVSIGDGIYKSTDGGETWTHMGLNDSEHIVKILIDPTNTNTVYACVPGKLCSDSDDRGVYKTTDGGKTWTKVLAGTNASTGCSMMTMDPKAPKTLFAGMWDFRRKGWTFRSGGDGPEDPSGERVVQEHRRRRDVDRARRQEREGTAAQAVGTRCGHRRAVQAERRLRVHRGGAAAQRPLSLRRRRRDVGAARPQPEHALAPLLLREPDRRSEEREPHLQAGRPAHHEHRRRRDVQRHQRRHARRPPRRVDRSARTPTT